MHRDIKKIIGDIKSLKIQGARNVAKAAVNGLAIAAKKSKTKTAQAFSHEMRDVANALATSRPTEPMMRNMLDEGLYFIEQAIKSKKTTKSSLVKLLVNHEKQMINKMELDAKRLAQYGAKLIPDDALVLTYCHSSTTTRILIEAKRMRKKFSVVAFETRPRFQGRITAAELAKAGIDVTLTVDGAMYLFMKKADIVIVGADSITSRGDLINKIGTATIAHIAKMNDVSFYSAAELSKYSAMTIFGTREKIEERNSKEVWEKPPKGVTIRNPAFEATAAKYINGYITEIGVIPPQSFFTMATNKLGIKLYE
ncbi:MAG: S-methyl-5-thioribose-1-phosphate isomerase [Candidatus Micrarchaeota archaeon]